MYQGVIESTIRRIYSYTDIIHVSLIHIHNQITSTQAIKTFQSILYQNVAKTVSSIMAEKVISSTPSEALKKLEEQLTCAICLNLYTNPKSLPCFHSFCQQCLEGLPQDPQGDEYFISCPTCRHRTHLPEPKGAADFPAAFQINNLKEVHNLMIKVSGHQQVICDICTTTNATGYFKECNKFLCKNCINIHKSGASDIDHNIASFDEVDRSASQILSLKQETKCSSHDKPLEFFCEKCEELICHDCSVRMHKDHKYNSVVSCYSKHYHTLETNLKGVSDNVANVTDVLAALADREDKIRTQGESIKEEIRATVKEIINTLQQSEKQLIGNVDEVSGSKLQILSEQKKSAEIKLIQLKDCKESVTHSLKIGNPQRVVTSAKQLLDRMRNVSQKVIIEELNPKEIADLHFNKSIIGDTLGDIICLQQCKMKEIDPVCVTTTTTKEKTISFPLSIQCSDSSLLRVPLSSLSCSIVPVGTATSITTTITTTTHPGVYTIQCSTVGRGRHQVNVQVNNVQVDGTSLVIPFNPYVDNITPVCTITDLKVPYGVVVTKNGHVIISEKDKDCLTILDENKRKVKSLAQKFEFWSSSREGTRNVELTKPRGVAITQDNFILVTNNHKIQKISMDGKCITSIGKKGRGPLEFNDPCGVTISPTKGNIYIADQYNHRIQVLNPDLTFSHEFGTNGSADGQLSYPSDVTIDRQGQVVYVADTYNHRIQKFTPEGKFLSQFGTYGSDPGQLSYPSGIVIDNNNLVYVTESYSLYGTFRPRSINHRISIFTSDGHFINFFGREGSAVDCFNGPLGMTIDSEGYLYVCDSWNNRVVVY